MRNITSGVLAGIAGALAMGATMVLGRKAGFLHQTLDQDSEEWLDRNFDARRHLGDAGTTALEQGNHLAAGAAFGALYAQLPETRLPSVLSGALYGAGLYAVNIAVAAPVPIAVMVAVPIAFMVAGALAFVARALAVGTAPAVVLAMRALGTAGAHVAHAGPLGLSPAKAHQGAVGGKTRPQRLALRVLARQGLRDEARADLERCRDMGIQTPVGQKCNTQLQTYQ